MSELEKNKLILVLDAVISIALIVGILYYVGVDKFISELYSVNLFYLFLSVVMLLFMYIGMAARIKILLKEQGIELGWMETMKSHVVGMLVADFTPARSGYFATAGMLHYKYNAPSEKAMVSVMGPTIFDFTLKVLAGTTAVMYFLWQFLSQDNKILLFAASALMIFMIIVMILLLFSKRFLQLFGFVKRFPIANSVYALFERMQNTSHVVVKRTPELIALLLFTWSAKAISWYFAAKSLGITVNVGMPEVIFYFFFQPLITMLEFMPSPTIAGLGLSEGGAALVLALFGIPNAKATAFSILVRFKTIAVNLIAVPEAISMIRKKEI